MGLLNVLCDGPIYNDRTAFLMIVSALLRIPGNVLTNSLFFNPLKFPLTYALNLLVFDCLFRPYTIKLVQHITYKEENIYRIGSTPFLLDSDGPNEKLFSETLSGYGSLVFEFVFFTVDTCIPHSHFIVIREDLRN
jgi:hypothetical protein